MSAHSLTRPIMEGLFSVQIIARPEEGLPHFLLAFVTRFLRRISVGRGIVAKTGWESQGRGDCGIHQGYLPTLCFATEPWLMHTYFGTQDVGAVYSDWGRFGFLHGTWKSARRKGGMRARGFQGVGFFLVWYQISLQHPCRGFSRHCVYLGTPCLALCQLGSIWSSFCIWPTLRGCAPSSLWWQKIPSSSLSISNEREKLYLVVFLQTTNCSKGETGKGI